MKRSLFSAVSALAFTFIIIITGCWGPTKRDASNIAVENEEKRNCACAEHLEESQMSRRVDHIEMGADVMGSHVNVRGLALMEVTVDNDGSVLCAQALSGHPLAITHLIEASRRWKFKPYLKNGSAQRYCGRLRLRFAFVENEPSVEVVGN